MHLSVIVPAFDEETGLKKNINIYSDYLKSCGFDYEIIIVDDGSTDQTHRTANELAKEDSHIQCLHKEKNEGKGSAIRSGFIKGTGDYLLFLDADNATSIDHLEKVWPLFDSGCDLVIGTRNKNDISEASQAVSQNIFKRVLGIFGNKLIKLFTGLNINDTQCGFKIMNKKCRDLIIPKTKINRWAIDVEILMLAKKHGLKIGIIPVVWRCGPTSRVRIKGYFIAFQELIKIKFNK